MSDIIRQVPNEGEHGWHLMSYWTHDDPDEPYTVDPYTDGDHDGIDEAEVPTVEQEQRAWRDYYEHAAATGSDPLNALGVRGATQRRERWEFRLNDSIIGPVFIDARRAGRVYRAADLPAHVREWLTLASDGRRITAFERWAELEAAQPGIRRYRWFTVSFDGAVVPRGEHLIRRDVRRAARRALADADAWQPVGIEKEA